MIHFIIFWLLLEIVGAIRAAWRIAHNQPVYEPGHLYIAPLVIAGIMGLAQAGLGSYQKMKATRMAQANKRPNLDRNPYVQEAYDLTASQAQKGLSDAALQAYNANNDRNLSSSISAILKAGGSANNIAGLYDDSNAGLRQVALVSDERKMQNINQFLNQGLKPMADQDRDQYYTNQYVPYKDTAALSASLSEQGMNDIFKGANTVAGGLLNDYYGKMYDKKDKDNATKYMPAPYASSVAAPVMADPRSFNTAGAIRPGAQPSAGFNGNLLGPATGGRQYNPQQWNPYLKWNYLTGQYE